MTIWFGGNNNDNVRDICFSIHFVPYAILFRTEPKHFALTFAKLMAFRLKQFSSVQFDFCAHSSIRTTPARFMPSLSITHSRPLQFTFDSILAVILHVYVRVIVFHDIATIAAAVRFTLNTYSVFAVCVVCHMFITV